MRSNNGQTGSCTRCSLPFVRFRPYLGYRANQVLAYSRRKLSEDGIAPSYGMICDELGINTRGEVSRIVSDLERRGLLRRVGRGKVRRIRLPA
jgi:SOS-response transcriptional repressor LexA